MRILSTNFLDLGSGDGSKSKCIIFLKNSLCVCGICSKDLILIWNTSVQVEVLHLEPLKIDLEKKLVNREP